MIKLRGFMVPVLAAALLALSAGTGYGLVSPFMCVANAAVPPTVRSEGTAELLGDLVLDCTGGVAGTPLTVNVTLFLNTNVTSRILALPATAEALLLIDEPAPEAQVLNTNVFQGLVTGNSISWPNISFTAPGGAGHRTIRLANLRGNAAGIGGAFSTVQGLVTSSGNASMPIANPTQILAYVQKGMNFSAGSAAFDPLLAPGAGGNPLQFSITFSEAFPTAFKKKLEGAFQNIPGVITNTESGLTSSVAGAAGLADTGTRLVARFSRVPSGVSLRVPATVTSGTFTAVLVTGMGADLSGGTPAVSGDIALTGDSGIAVWEVISTDYLTVENITIPVTISYPPGISGGTATVSGSLGPVSVITSASATAPLPRFAEQAAAVTAFHIPTSVPTLSEWGMLLFMLLAGTLSVYCLRKSDA